MFVKKLNEVTEQICSEFPGRNSVYFFLYHASKIWCNQLDLPKNIADYILRGYSQLNQIQELTIYIYEEWKPKQQQRLTFLGLEKYDEESQLYKLVNRIFALINIKSQNMKMIALIAFVITAVGYLLYKLNQQPEQRTRAAETRHIDNYPSPSIQRIPKQFLVLVISASQSDFIKLLDAKQVIDIKDAEKLYKFTKYLWLGSENNFNQQQANLKNYSVTAGESEYDINLVCLELKQSEEGFKPNINQLDRYDAFRKLPDLVVNFTISPRLQMEAYENFEVYNR
ncbi:hypothetical protein [Nostoc sp. TCL26-01]|uniref:hypothetical protein n=1 Tax=Nostoc sp. TCL26-01 TaxID=2576904 RepID=UPI0015BE29E9|nr:hypothetical protein [Nostoc sp. TCL26-01]QLE59903.1 hypothetical protein FD725_31255 [Nostoc sp. TCL26-01]